MQYHKVTHIISPVPLDEGITVRKILQKIKVKKATLHQKNHVREPNESDLSSGWNFWDKETFILNEREKTWATSQNINFTDCVWHFEFELLRDSLDHMPSLSYLVFRLNKAVER